MIWNLGPHSRLSSHTLETQLETLKAFGFQILESYSLEMWDLI